jgi:AcrR family transcriptional regulator
MKVSKEQKLETRQAVIRAAVDIMTEKGFKPATMRHIARTAGIGDATIYNYFPAKEDILYAYYEDHLEACAAKAEKVQEFESFSFQESLQTFLENSLDHYLADREFVDMTFKDVFFSMSHNFSRLKPIHDKFLLMVRKRLDKAIMTGEFPGILFQEVIVRIFWDFYVVTVMYWLSDRSQGFSHTSAMIDKGLDLVCTILKSGLMDKVFDMGMFLLKNHVLVRMDSIREQVHTAHHIKEIFLGKRHERSDPEE